MWRSVVATLMDFFYPPRCPVCRKTVQKVGDFCPECRPNVDFGRLPLSGEAKIVLADVWRVAPYQGSMKRIIADLKFNGEKNRLMAINEILGGIAEELAAVAGEFDAAVPVPLHKDRQKKRGFNQVELIFAPHLESLGLKCMPYVRRERATRPQFNLNFEERRQNLQDAFAVDGEKICGGKFLLLDDIMTTGATLIECAKVLRRGGAAKVSALVLASDR